MSLASVVNIDHIRAHSAESKNPKRTSPVPYQSPISDFRFLMDHVVGFEQVAQTDRFAEATPDTCDAILTEAAKLSDEVLGAAAEARRFASGGSGKRCRAHLTGLC